MLISNVIWKVVYEYFLKWGMIWKKCSEYVNYYIGFRFYRRLSELFVQIIVYSLVTEVLSE